ncbi:MAG TPA: glycoside hydrolase family 13 protein [Candidatus Caenarcaniphilales bacterium]|nr:glycoside hydrolase family 13 protein [Candidatus Caenarcaniphilales bacterium]
MTAFADTPAWVRDAVFYQIFPDRFAASKRVQKPGPLEPWAAAPTPHGFKGGDLLGIVERLDYLQQLGITALYLTPVFASASNHRYHTYDYYRVDPLLGGDEALRELLDACHARGMRVVLDGVFNHSGRGFWPFHHVVENGASSPYVDWFYVDQEALAAGQPLRPYPDREGLRVLDQAASAEQHRRGDVSLGHLGYRAWWDLPALPKLNTGNPHMREHLLAAAEHWLRFGIDGWRLDVPEEIDADFWREFRTRVRAVNPEAYIVGEIWRVKPEWLAGDTFDALMNYPLTEALLSFVAGESLDREIVATQHEYRDFVRPIDGAGFGRELGRLLSVYRPEVTAVQLNLLGSHDTPRFLTVVGSDRAALRLATLAQMTLPGAPCIYYGDEVGLEGRHDPDSRRAFPWGDGGVRDDDLLAFVSAATRLRHAEGVLRHGSYRTLAAAGHAIAYGRFGGSTARDRSSAAVVVLNAGTEPAHLTVTAPELDGLALRPHALPTTPAPLLADGGEPGSVEISVPPRSGGVLLAGTKR